MGSNPTQPFQNLGTGWTVGREDLGSNPTLPFQNLGNFIHSTLPVSFRRDAISHWCLLSGVYARGSKRSCCGIHLS